MKVCQNLRHKKSVLMSSNPSSSLYNYSKEKLAKCYLLYSFVITSVLHSMMLHSLENRDEIQH